MNTGQFSGSLKDNTSPDRLANGLQKVQSYPVLPSGRWATYAREELYVLRLWEPGLRLHFRPHVTANRFSLP